MDKLRFGKGNAKLGKETAIFSLPAGFTCPGALLCLSKSDRATGKLTDGKQTQFRCYAASAENLFTNIRIGRWRNFELLKGKSVADMAALIDASLPRKAKLVRLHQSGDFFSQTYFDAWVLVANWNPGLIFYGYTKALPFWIARLGSIPANMKLVASRGGRFDNLIETNTLRSVLVVYTEEQAKTKNLPLDHDDTQVWKGTGDFAILLHGTQPAGSEAGKAWHIIKTQGQGGYKADYFAHYTKSGKMSANRQLAIRRQLRAARKAKALQNA